MDNICQFEYNLWEFQFKIIGAESFFYIFKRSGSGFAFSFRLRSSRYDGTRRPDKMDALFLNRMQFERLGDRWKEQTHFEMVALKNDAHFRAKEPKGVTHENPY